MIRLNRLPFCLLALLAAIPLACGKGSFSSLEEYRAWLNDSENGLVQGRSVAGVKLSVKYLPPEYMARQELGSRPTWGRGERDSILKEYQGSINFLLTVGSEEHGSGDVMMRGVASYDEFTQRTMTLNFEMARQITLRVDGKTYTPVLAALDNDYGISGSRSVLFAFDAPADLLSRAGSIDFVLNDEVFSTGINHFPFAPNDIRERPALTF